MSCIFLFLFGYVEYTVSDGELNKLANLVLGYGSGIKIKGGKIKVRLGKHKKFEELIGTRVNLIASAPKGFGGFLYSGRCSWGIMAGLLLSLIVYIFASGAVWDIRVECDDEALSDSVITELSESGLHIGARWNGIDTSLVENEILSDSEKISWININRRGCVAYIKVVGKTVPEPEEIFYSNIVAKEDGIIESITVRRGIAKVSVGQSVKRGDVLISGVIPFEFGGGLCHAEGEVIARVSGQICTEVSDERRETVKDEPICISKSIKILNFSINFYVNYGKLPDECVIINKTDYAASESGKKLPYAFVSDYVVPYTESTVKLSRADMIELASEKLNALISEKLSDATMLKISTEGGFLNGSYIMSAEYVCLKDIGTDLPFYGNGAEADKR